MIAGKVLEEYEKEIGVSLLILKLLVKLMYYKSVFLNIIFDISMEVKASRPAIDKFFFYDLSSQRIQS